jgi:IS30 family transposase
MEVHHGAIERAHFVSIIRKIRSQRSPKEGDVREIASLLNVSESTVRTHLKRGIRQIRSAIGGHSPDVQAVLSCLPSA